ncbi:MAG: DUF2911 domain-containing protein [Bacteroidota bacterium]
MKKTITLVVALFAFMALSVAQIQTPAASPFAKLEATAGLTKITIEYSRPGMKGRTIFGELVPYGEVWRTAANQATKITFDKDVQIAGKDLKKGSYAILTKPMADEWTVMLFEYTSGSWGAYLKDDAKLAVEVKVPAKKVSPMVESFTMSVGSLKDDSATIDIMWADTKVSIPVDLHTKKEAMASIDRVMAGPSQNDYYAAASYLHSTGDLDQAYKYIVKATDGDNPRFWQVRRKALILADMGKKTEAIAAAKVSMELAQKAGNKDYVRMNEKSIAEWSGGKTMMKDAKKMDK